MSKYAGFLARTRQRIFFIEAAKTAEASVESGKSLARLCGISTPTTALLLSTVVLFAAPLDAAISLSHVLGIHNAAGDQAGYRGDIFCRLGKFCQHGRTGSVWIGIELRDPPVKATLVGSSV